MKIKVKIGDLVEALGAINEGDDISTLGSTLKVSSPYGYKSIESVHKTQLNPEWEIETISGKKIIVADKHRLETKSGWFDKANNRYWSFVEDLKIGDEIYTEDGWEKLIKCRFNGKQSAMYDLQVIDNHSYYANKIHNHNTIWLVNLGLKSLLHGQNVLHYTMEMSEDRVGQRYDSIASKIEAKELIGSSAEVKAKYKTYTKITKSRLKIKEFPTAMASILDFEAHMEQLRLYNDFIPDIILCDYGDIMRSTRQTHGSYEEQGWIFRELRGLAVKHNVAIITGTQARRDALAQDGGTKDVVGMDQVADSMEKNRIIDGLFSITQSRAEKDDGIMRLWVAKNRNGESNKDLEFRINYRLLELKDSPSINPLSDDEDANTN